MVHSNLSLKTFKLWTLLEFDQIDQKSLPKDAFHEFLSLHTLAKYYPFPTHGTKQLYPEGFLSLVSSSIFEKFSLR